MISDPWQIAYIGHPDPNCLVSANVIISISVIYPPSPTQDLQSSSCCHPSAHRQLTCLLIVNIPVIQVLMVFIQSSRLSPEQGLVSFISSETSYVLNILLLTLSTPAPLMSLRGKPGPCPFNSLKSPTVRLPTFQPAGTTFPPRPLHGPQLWS